MNTKGFRIRHAVAIAIGMVSLTSTGWAGTLVVSAPPGIIANGQSIAGRISRDGRYVVFSSTASNIVPGDGNNKQDIFVRDNFAQTIERVSVSSTGVEADDDSSHASISADGRFVVFISEANNLGVSTGSEVFVRDRVAGTTEFIAHHPGVSVTGTERVTSISADGRYVVFTGYSNELPGQQGGNCYRFDRGTQTLEQVDVTWDGTPTDEGIASEPVISADGRYVAFISPEPDLAPGDTRPDPAYSFDVFVRDMVAQTTERVNYEPDGQPMEARPFRPDISGDGRFVTFIARGRVYVRDRQTGITEAPDVEGDGGEDRVGRASITGNGRYIAFTNDEPPFRDTADVFRYDRYSGHTLRVSVPASGTQGNGRSTAPSISDDGSAIAYASTSTNLVTNQTGVFVTTLPPVTRWLSQNVTLSPGSPQATVQSFDGPAASIDFYESTDDQGTGKDFLFGSYSSGGHPQAFNKLQGFWSADGFYPYAGKSSIGRGSDAGESNAPSPLGVFDLQLHPPQNNHLAVAAFQVPQDGNYSVRGLGVRRVDENGLYVRLKLIDSKGDWRADLEATPSRAWSRSSQVYDLGALHTGDQIYFGVGADGEYDFDATEIAWEIEATGLPARVERFWDSYDSDNNLPIEYFESTDSGYPAPGRPFNVPGNAHPDEFNHLVSYTAPAGELYPYAGRSSVPRGADVGESNAPSPLGVSDMQLHPPADARHAVAAFHVTETGEYYVSDLAVRRVDENGNAVRFYLYAHGDTVATLTAYPDRAWVRSDQTYSLGTLQAGDSIYFAVNSHGSYDYDAAEIAWKIHAYVIP